MREKILENIKTYNLIEKGDFILVGFSGGMDSTALLFLLMEIREELDLTISIAHLNHGVRGEEADRDEEFSKNIGKKLGIIFRTEQADMHGLAKEKKISKEDAGRILRQDFFKRVAEEIGANKIALAHNYNDQVETLIMRIIRGTGIDGLRGIEFKNGDIIRPILNITREKIEEYIKANKFPYVEDSTNLESEYHRNKIRNILLPLLRDEYNPNIDSSIFNLSELARIDGEFLDKITNEEFNNTCLLSNGELILDIIEFKKLDKSIQNRIIRLAFQRLTGKLSDFSFANVEEIMELMDLDSGKFIDNIKGISIRNSYGKLIFEEIQGKMDYSIYNELEMGINNFNGYIITLKEVKNPVNSKKEITIPKEIIRDKLIVRNRKDGDFIRPVGLNGTKKLKNIFIDKKIDRNLRDDYLIISDSKNVFWVLGLVKSEITEFESKTQEYISITIEKLEE